MRKEISIIVAIVAILSIIGCGSEDWPKGPYYEIPAPPGYNKIDSLAFVELSMYDDVYLDPVWAEVDLSDISTWINRTYWELDKEANEYRITKLNISFVSIHKLSPSIGMFERCTRLDLWGPISGEMPEDICSLPLRSLVIMGTNITKLPDDIFNENIKYIKFCHNYSFKAENLPPSMNKLKDEKNRRFDFSENDFVGNMPIYENASVYFAFNKFTGIDWTDERWYTSDCVPYGYKNLISTYVPDDLQSDPKRYVHLIGRIGLQDKGGKVEYDKVAYDKFKNEF